MAKTSTKSSIDMQRHINLFPILILFSIFQISQASTINISKEQQAEIFTKINQIQNNGHINDYNLTDSAVQASNKENKDKKTQIYFNDVVLYHQISPSFAVGEIFQIVGRVKQDKLRQYQSRARNKRTFIVTVAFISKSTNQRRVFSEEFYTNEIQFSIQCYLTKQDNYYFGIFIGDNGVFTPQVVSIIQASSSISDPELMSQTPAKPRTMNFQIIRNQMYIIWQPVTKLSKLVFTQQSPFNISLEFIISNDIGKFKIPYAQFANFSPNQVTIYLSHAQCEGLTSFQRNSNFSTPFFRSLNITEHHFRQIRSEYIQITSEIPSQLSLYQNLSIRGKSKEQIHKQAFIVEPDLQIIENTLSGPIKDKNYIQPQQQFELSQRILDQGIYIVEINHARGFALVNTPIYAGNKFPLLPDYHDIYTANQSMNLAIRSANISEQRKYMLELINAKRAEFGAQPLVLNEQLNYLAGNHSQDMAYNYYVSHVNPYGQGSRQRALKAGITAPVGQNIGVHEDLGYTHYRLTRSPGHLKNMINKKWSTIGIGIIYYSGRYYMTQQYSTNKVDSKSLQLDKEQIQSLKQEIISLINAQAPIQVKENISFSNDVQQIYTARGKITSQEVQIIMRKHDIKQIKMRKLAVGYSANWAEKIAKGGHLQYRGKPNVAVAFKLNENMNLSVFMGFF